MPKNSKQLCKFIRLFPRILLLCMLRFIGETILATD